MYTMNMSPSPKRILVTGTIAEDHLLGYDAQFLDKLRTVAAKEELSVSFQTDSYIQKPGGTGANMAWNLMLLQQNPYLVARIGTDGKQYLDMMHKRGIDTSGITVDESEKTPTGICCTDTKGHQIWFFHQGADAIVEWPENVPHDITYAIIGPRYYETMVLGMQWCKANKIPTLFDPGQQITKFEKEELLKAIDCATGVIANDFEWSLIEHTTGLSPEEISTHVEYVIMTHGEEGHSIFIDGKRESFPRCDADTVVNPTGAGDAFRAGLLTGLTHDWTLQDATKLGAAAASFVVEQDGTLLENLDHEQVWKRAEQAFGTVPPL